MAKKQTSNLVRCIDCKFAELYQRNNDPIIAACTENNYDRDVANAQRSCSKHQPDNSKKIINRL